MAVPGTGSLRLVPIMYGVICILAVPDSGVEEGGSTKANFGHAPKSIDHAS